MNIDDEIKRLYVEEKYTLRRIGEIVGKDHHFIKRRLIKMKIEITRKGRIMKPFTEEHKQKLAKSSKGRISFWKGKKMPLVVNYKNMATHLQWDVDLDFLMSFDDFEKLKCLNKMLSRDRVSVNFDTEKYKQFIKRFYYDDNFNNQFEIYKISRNRWDMPSLDHIIPLCKGGTWDINNLQIISWFENRAKCSMNNIEFEELIKKYFRKYFV